MKALKSPLRPLLSAVVILLMVGYNEVWVTTHPMICPLETKLPSKSPLNNWYESNADLIIGNAKPKIKHKIKPMILNQKILLIKIRILLALLDDNDFCFLKSLL